MKRKGFSMIEVLSPCPIYWRMSSLDSMRFIDEEMTRTYPLGIFKDWEGETS
jgi:2-oxoglutarate ferredoxin oxidoreductase subunit beta